METHPYRDAELAAFILRVALGVMYFSHGCLKLGVYGMSAAAAYFESVGVPGEWVYPTVVAELAGGVLLILGIHARWVALALLPILLGAAQVHWANGWVFSAEGGGWEFPAYLIVWSAGQALLGNGAFALGGWKSAAGVPQPARLAVGKPTAEMLQAIAAERPYLLRLASRRLRNAELSEDVVQATLAAAVAGAGSFRQNSSMRTWLTSILRNRIVDVQRARRREPLLDDLPRGAISLDAPATAPDPADIMQALEAASALRARLRDLPKAALAAFTMRELQGRSSKEILERLRLTPSQYWQALHRARRALRAAIENSEATLC